MSDTKSVDIPDEAVEAAAAALWEPSFDGDTWAEESAVHKDQIRAEASRALEAAAPHMLAGAKADAWDEGHESGFWNGRLSQLTAPYDAPTPDIGADHAKATNPYRSQA